MTPNSVMGSGGTINRGELLLHMQGANFRSQPVS